MRLRSKDSSQQPIKYMVALSNYNASIVEFIRSGKPPMMLPSQIYD